MSSSETIYVIHYVHMTWIQKLPQVLPWQNGAPSHLAPAPGPSSEPIVIDPQDPLPPPAPRHKRPAEAGSSSAVSVPKLAPTAKNSPSSGQDSGQVSNQGQVNPAPAPAPALAAAPAPAPSPAAAPAPGDPSVGPPQPLLNSVQKLVFQRFISNNVIPGYVTNYLFNLC